MRLKQNENTGFWTACVTEDGEYYGELSRVHSPDACAPPRGCGIHNRPSNHALKDAPMFWWDSTGTLERICKHGIGHPDHDSAIYLQSIGQGESSLHTCDGCCL